MRHRTPGRLHARIGVLSPCTRPGRWDVRRFNGMKWEDYCVCRHIRSSDGDTPHAPDSRHPRSARVLITVGDGETIVLLHGGLADNSTWAAQFSGLSPHRHVVAPERQAQGHTPDRPGPLTYQAMAEQTVSFLLALDLGPVDLLGWSDGGMVGTLIAAEHPELVRTLTVTGSGFEQRVRAGRFGGPGGSVTWR